MDMLAFTKKGRVNSTKKVKSKKSIFKNIYTVSDILKHQIELMEKGTFMFGKKKETCCICNQNEGDKKISDGAVCKNCISKCGPFLLTLSWKNIPADRIRQAITANELNAKNLSIFHSTNKFDKYIDLDENNKLWKSPHFSPTLVFSYNDIVSYELLENGEAITKGSFGAALVGAALLGKTGAIIGSNIGSKKTKQEINEYRIKIVTRNLCYPEIYINFLTTGSVKSNSILYKTYVGYAQRVLSLLAIITDTTSNSRNTSALDTVEEIRKYKELLDEGIITQEEFNTKKEQLL